ncbi:MAG: DNA recombination protein RmuC [Patescibacteria group bacterium]
MTLDSILIIIVLIAGFVAIFWYLNKQKNQPEKEDKSFLMLQNQIHELTNQLQDKIDKSSQHSSQMLQSQFIETSKISKDVTEKLMKLEETNRQVVGFTDQLQNLEKIFTNSKTRGAVGETSLELILNNILPPQAYSMQYSFKDGSIVDAIIRIKDKILPIDAKFSLTNYQRIIDEDNVEKKKVLEKDFKADLKKRIEETSKYIKPGEDTLDFAFMFIPAEGIYYDLLVDDTRGSVNVNSQNLIDYAFRDKHVVIVSPTTFAAYLQTVVQGLRALQIEESAKEIRQNVEKLQRHLAMYHEQHRKIGSQLGTVITTYNTSSKEFNKIDKDILKITKTESLLDAGIELLDKPHQEDED